MDPKIRKEAEIWATSEHFDPATRSEVAELLEKNQEQELIDRFYKDLTFGTGGLRGILGAGSSRMNVYNIRKATTAFARYLIDQFGPQNLRLAISYDSRKFSREFAEATAEVCAGHGIQALITKELRPVPMLSYLVRRNQCHGGVCITASHNPPNYNGYKVYWQTGGQVVPPHDEEIIKRYEELQDQSEIRRLDFKEALKRGLILEIGDELDQEYFDRVEGLSLSKQGRDNFKIVFTPLHGTAGYPVTTCLKRFGFKDVSVVPEQYKPDGSFPTVDSPNPEDPKALKMAIALAEKEKADLVLGTDPDCDRVGIVVRENDQYTILNGNQIGSLLIEYTLSQRRALDRMPSNPLVIKTIVTTDLQNRIGEHYGAAVEETLTGFKWICQRIEGYESGKIKPHKTFVCGGEESYGFLADSFVRDKDGIIACCIAAEMTAHYKAQGLSLSDVLDQIYRRHGVFQESLATLVCEGHAGAQQIDAMMTGLRRNPPQSICETPVVRMDDLESSKRFTFERGSLTFQEKIELPESDVLQFFLADGSKVSVRPSGTEPKIKFYVSVRQEVDSRCSDEELKRTKEQCHKRVKAIEAEFMGLAR